MPLGNALEWKTPIAGGNNTSMAENYYLFFKPLPVGDHTIECFLQSHVGLKGRYTKLSPDELLEGNDKNLGYLSAMEHLIICNENRLRRKVEVLQVKANRLEELAQTVADVKKQLGID